MTGPIRVVPDELATQMAALAALAADQTLRNYARTHFSSSMLASQGAMADQLKEYNDGLQRIVEHLYDLIQATLDVLNGVHASIVTADETAAHEIAQATLVSKVGA